MPYFLSPKFPSLTFRKAQPLNSRALGTYPNRSYTLYIQSIWMNFQTKRPPKTESLQSLAVTNPHLFLIGLQDVLNSLGLACVIFNYFVFYTICQNLSIKFQPLLHIGIVNLFLQKIRRLIGIYHFHCLVALVTLDALVRPNPKVVFQISIQVVVNLLA